MDKDLSPDISLCLIAKNEEHFLKKHLPIISNFVSEIIYVDTGSSDFSVEIASEYTDKIFVRKWKHSFEDARNFAIKKASKKWILVLDADEIISPRDFPKIKHFLNNFPDVAGFIFYQRSYLNDPSTENFIVNKTDYPEGMQFKGYIDIPVVRLFKNTPQVKYTGAAHDLVEYSIEKENKINTKIPIHHYGMVRGINKSIEKDKEYLKQLKKDLKKYPNLFKTHYTLGRLLYRMGKYNEAEERTKKAIEIRSNSSEAYFLLSMIYYMQGKYEEAKISAEMSLKFNNNNAEAHHILGILNMLSGKKTIAEKHFIKACLLNPGNPKFNSSLAAFYIENGKMEKAFKIAKETYFNFPEFPPAIINYMKIMAYYGNNQAVIENAKKLLKIDKSYALTVKEILGKL